MLKKNTVLNNRYIIEEVLGQGGFGITYAAFDKKMHLKVAVKEYFPHTLVDRDTDESNQIFLVKETDSDVVSVGIGKFLNEARVLAAFWQEPGIVGVRDFFPENNTAYIVMEYLKGKNLSSYLIGHKFGADDIFMLMEPVMDSLEKVHSEGLIHRDISPDNIFYQDDGTLKLVDFGAARVYADDKRTFGISKDGYTPPEQYSEEGMGPWTDVYSLCATIYKCITGTTPDNGWQRSREDKLKWPSELGCGISVHQEYILKKGMSVSPEDRFQDIASLKKALEDPLEIGEDDKPTVARRLYPGNDEVPGNGKAPGSGKLPGKTGQDVGRADGEIGRNWVLPGIGRPLFLIAAVALVCAAMFALNPNRTAAPNPAAGTLMSEETPAVEGGELPSESAIKAEEGGDDAVPDGYDKETTYKISLSINDDIALKDYNQALETLRQRVALLADGHEYEVVEKEGQNIELYLSKEIFEGYDVVEMDKIISDYIAGPAILHLSRDSMDSTVILSDDLMRIEREDMETVSMGHGPIDGVDDSGAGVKSEPCPYIEIALTDECAEKVRENVALWEGRCTLILNRAPNFHRFQTYHTEDFKSFYIVDGYLDGKYMEILMYNLTHKPLIRDFLHNIDSRLEINVIWDSVESAETVGEYQCNIDELHGDTLTVSIYKPGEDQLTEGKWFDAKLSLQERLDALEQPYAIGYKIVPEREYLVFKTGLGRMGRPIIDSIMLNYISLGNVSWGTGSILKDNYSVEWIPDSDGNYCARFRFDEAYWNTLNQITDKILREADGQIYLYFGEMPVLGTVLEQAVDDGQIDFNTCCFLEDEKITKENDWVAKYVEAVCGKTAFPRDFYYHQSSIAGLDGEKPGSEKYGISYKNGIQYTKEKILEVFPDAKVDVDGLSVHVDLPLEIDETLPEKMTFLVKEIYQAIDFNYSLLNKLDFYLANEDNTVMERARIFFSKDINIYDNNGYFYGKEIKMHAICGGGRIDRYVGAFDEIFNTDPFYQNLNGS